VNLRIVNNHECVILSFCNLVGKHLSRSVCCVCYNFSCYILTCSFMTLWAVWYVDATRDLLTFISTATSQPHDDTFAFSNLHHRGSIVSCFLRSLSVSDVWRCKTRTHFKVVDTLQHEGHADTTWSNAMRFVTSRRVHPKFLSNITMGDCF
jgi:hypothetical protein